jgi:hypothetical protein
MTEAEQFKQSRRSFSKLLALASGLPLALFAQETKRIPIVLKWDIQPANSSIEQEFLVTEYRNYYFYVAFNKGGPFDVKELRKFTGDGGHQIVTKDPVPIVVIPKTNEEVRRAYELVRTGVYEYRFINLGVVMPVHLILERLVDERKTALPPIVDETFNTDRICFGLDRAITGVALKPGKYRIKLNTLQETSLPSGAESSLVIAYRPKTRVLTDRK